MRNAQATKQLQGDAAEKIDLLRGRGRGSSSDDDLPYDYDALVALNDELDARLGAGRSSYLAAMGL